MEAQCWQPVHELSKTVQTRLDEILQFESKSFEERKERKEGKGLEASDGGLPRVEAEKKKKKDKERKSVTLNLVSEESARPRDWPPCACRKPRCRGCPYV